ncbi:MAG: 30S ribosomal protein S17 [Candidatus Omnitrophica bacterium]|nr:30S ribosomal protein S17 [Candidatus Omnitrophota bacterium]
MSTENTDIAAKVKAQGRKRTRGVVLSRKMNKTAIVRCVTLTRHALYGKVMKRAIKFKVHVEKNSANAGDWVEIEAVRPISKEKHFRLVKILKKAA